MATNCKDDQQRRDGSGQDHRFLPALEPASAPLDDRGMNDILVFAKHYADLVRFYDIEEANNQQSRTAENNFYTWKDFFYKDIAVVIASIMQYTSRINQLKGEYDELRKKSDEDPTIAKYNTLVKSIIGHLQRITRWYGRSINDHPLKKELEVKILSVLKPALLQLIAYDKGSNILVPDHDHSWHHRNEKKYEEFREYPWNCLYEEVARDAEIYIGKKNEDKIKHAALYLDDIFLSVLKVYKDLTARSDFYMNAAVELYPEHQPHMALFIAFVKLFGYAQKELNTITKRHLEFYYRDVLHLQERAANPDSVYLIYELAKEATEYDLKAGTSVTAGKDATGKELIYKTTDELVVNKAKVKELKTLFFNDFANNLFSEKKVFAAADAKSEDGNGLPFKNPESAWPAQGFFRPEFTYEPFKVTNLNGTEAKLGFAIASPQLLLAEGKRQIKISITGTDFTQLGEALEIQLSGLTGWIKINFNEELEDADIIPDLNLRAFYSISDDVESVKIFIPVADEAIIGYDEKIHGKGFDTKYPIIKFELRDTSIYAAAAIKEAKMGQVNIQVDVKGVKNLIVENDLAAMDISKMIYPFTPSPKKGLSFYIGSEEVFFKSLTNLSLSYDVVETADIEGENADHVPVPAPGPIHVKIALLNQKEWKYIPDGAAANSYTFSDVDEASGALTVFNNDDLIVDNLRELDHSNFPSKENSLSGFLRFDLDDKIFSFVIVNSNTNTAILPKTIIIKNVVLDYTSIQSCSATEEQFFHIYPFGAVKIFPLILKSLRSFDPVTFFRGSNDISSFVPTDSLMPQFKFGIDEGNTRTAQQQLQLEKDFFTFNQYEFKVWQQGHLYIGIENLTLPQNLSLLFKIADGTADDNDSDPPAINWSYLVNNQWRALPEENIISEGTYGLQATGIVIIDFPADATNNNSIITNGLHWLCLSVDKFSDRIPKIIDIIAQANKATFIDQQNDPEHYRNPLPESSISKLVTKIPEVKVITQPFESFDGKMREEGPVFYARASERLRHKHRAITSWDYEHLVLQHFPWVYKVKCLTHNDYNCICRHPNTGTPIAPVYDESKCCCGQVAPGHVLIVPISNLRNKNAVDILKPRTGRRTLLQIEEYLKKLTSPFVHVHAKNPSFEEIKTAFKVKFHTGTDKGKYKKQLNDDLVKFLTPWAFDATKEIAFGGKIYASTIINFIEERDYVDYITCFRMIHIVDGCCTDDSFTDVDCVPLQGPITFMPRPTDAEIAADPALLTKYEAEQKLLAHLKTEIEATSARAILTSVKHHCIELINETKDTGNCNCS